nr:MAG TPA: hypothetical protein [Caudoviricetes sp.]
MSKYIVEDCIINIMQKYIIENIIYDRVEKQEKLMFVHKLTNNAK